MASQSRFFTNFISGRRFLFFLVAAAMNRIPSTFCSFRRNSGVSSSVSVAFSTVATTVSNISVWLASSCDEVVIVVKLLGCLNVLRGDIFSIASVFFISGLVPSLLIMKPNHSTCLHAKLDLSNEIARFSSSSFVTTVWSFCRCVSIVPLVTIRISSRYYCNL